MASIEYDTNTMSVVLSQIESQVADMRKELQVIRSKNTGTDTYGALAESKNIERFYGSVVDQYGDVCGSSSSLAEMSLDLKAMKRSIVTAGIPPTLQNSFRKRIERLMEDVSDMREVASPLKSALEARIRFYSSCMYTKYDKVMGYKG